MALRLLCALQSARWHLLTQLQPADSSSPLCRSKMLSTSVHLCTEARQIQFEIQHRPIPSQIQARRAAASQNFTALQDLWDMLNRESREWCTKEWDKISNMVWNVSRALEKIWLSGWGQRKPPLRPSSHQTTGSISAVILELLFEVFYLEAVVAPCVECSSRCFGYSDAAALRRLLPLFLLLLRPLLPLLLLLLHATG